MFLYRILNKITTIFSKVNVIFNWRLQRIKKTLLVKITPRGECSSMCFGHFPPQRFYTPPLHSIIPTLNAIPALLISISIPPCSLASNSRRDLTVGGLVRSASTNLALCPSSANFLRASSPLAGFRAKVTSIWKAHHLSWGRLVQPFLRTNIILNVGFISMLWRDLLQYKELRL